VLLELQRPIIPRQRRGRIPIETPIHSRHDLNSAQAHMQQQQQQAQMSAADHNIGMY
jgi:hypothetical protein